MQSKPSKSKPRVIKDFLKLDEELQLQVLAFYNLADVEELAKKLQSYTEEAEELQKKVQSYTDPKTGQERFALPYETEDRFYMVRVDDFINTQVDGGSENDDDDDLLKNIEEVKVEKEDQDSSDDEDEEKYDRPEDILDEDDEEDDDVASDDEEEDDDNE